MYLRIWLMFSSKSSFISSDSNISASSSLGSFISAAIFASSSPIMSFFFVNCSSAVFKLASAIFLSVCVSVFRTSFAFFKTLVTCALCPLREACSRAISSMFEFSWSRHQIMSRKTTFSNIFIVNRSINIHFVKN